MAAKTESKNGSKPKKNWQNGLILAGVLIVVAVVFLFKNQTPKIEETASLSPEAQLDQYLEDEEPVFVFFHSTDCHSCVVMMDTVNQVYPEYENSVKMVDVNVYDPQNQNLLKQAQIKAIPTQVFIDASGNGRVGVGVMSAEDLRQQFQLLAGSKP